MVKLASDIFDPEQQTAYEKLVAEGGGIVWMRVGEGKTRPALMAASQIASNDGYPAILVVARRAAFYDWEQEIATLQLGVDVIELEQWQPNKLLNCQTVFLISEGKVFHPLTQDLIRSMHMNRMIGCIILDEGWLYKNPKAQKHLAVRRYAELHPTILLSGSIMTARNIMDIYGQVAAVGRARTLAFTKTKFQQQFMLGVGNPGGWTDWVPKRGVYASIMEKIAPFTHIYMPDVARVETKVVITKVKPYDKQLAYIKELKETAAIEGRFELTNMGNIITKAQQISDGWIKSSDETIEWFPSTKVNRLDLYLEELMETEFKVVVWCAFREDIKRLMPIALKHSLYVATLQSKEKFDIEAWKNPACRICLATEASGSSINHFAQVPYGIYFSQDFKWHSLQQSSGRHTRRSSKHTVAYNIFLHTEKSLDAQVHYTVKQSQYSEKSFIKQMAVRQWINDK